MALTEVWAIFYIVYTINRGSEMTRESLKESYTDCTKPLKCQRIWDYVQIVMHVVFTVCLVAAYVKAIGNGTDFVASRFIEYSGLSALFGFGTYAMIRSIIDIKAINKELKLFDDVYQSAIEALDAAERVTQKDNS